MALQTIDGKSVDVSDYYFGKMYDGSDVNVLCELEVNSEKKVFEFGTIQGIHVVTQTEMIPRFEIGSKEAIGLTKGKRMISGACVFGVISVSVIEEIKEQIGKAIDGTEKGEELQYLDELPPIKFVIVADNGVTKAKKEIIGVSLFDNSSAIGLNQLGSVQQCKFLATDITPLELI